MHSSPAGYLCAVLLFAIATGLGACQAPAKTTRLSVTDFEDVASEMAAKLQSSPLLIGRTSESAPMVVAVSKVENLSSDILSEGEKWYLVDRVFDADAIEALRGRCNMRFVIPAEKLRLLNKSQPVDAPAAEHREPTHTLTARLRSLSRAAGADRTDVYDCLFTMTELGSGEVVWSDAVAIKRVARGKAYN